MLCQDTSILSARSACAQAVTPSLTPLGDDQPIRGIGAEKTSSTPATARPRPVEQRMVGVMITSAGRRQRSHGAWKPDVRPDLRIRPRRSDAAGDLRIAEHGRAGVDLRLWFV